MKYADRSSFFLTVPLFYECSGRALNLVIFINAVLLLVPFLIWLCALTGRYRARKLARHRDPSYGATNNPRLVALRIRNAPCRSERNEKNTADVSRPSRRARVLASLTRRNSLSLFNARDEADRPSPSRTLCQSMIVRGAKKSQNWAPEGRRDTEMEAMRHDQAVRTTHIYHLSYLRTVLLRPPFYLRCSFTVLFGLVLSSYISLFLYLISSGVKIFWNGLLARRWKWKILFEQIFNEILGIKSHTWDIIVT